MSAISWKAGVSGDWSNPADWSGGAVPTSLDQVTIAASGSYLVTLFGQGAAGSLLLAAPGAELYDAGQLSVAGTFTLQAGTLALAYGSLKGGTLALAGGTLAAMGGTLDGVAVQGAVDLSHANATLFVQDGIRLAGAGGSGAGSIALTGGYAMLGCIGTETLDTATVAFGAPAGQNQGGPAILAASAAYGGTTATTLTLGHNLWLRDQTGSALLDIGPPIPQGLPVSVVNQGTITVSGAGDVLTVANSGTFVNAGTIGVSAGGTLMLSCGAFSNTGTIAVSNATLGFGGTFTTALLGQLGTLQLNGAVVEIAGTDQNAGATLAIGQGSTLGSVVLAGSIVGGTITDGGGGLVLSAGTGLLDGALYKGTLSLAAPNAMLTLTDNAEVATAQGGAGTILLTGANASLLLQGTEMLDNASASIGSATGTAVLGTTDYYLASVATTATLGAHFTLQQTGLSAALMANATSPIPQTGLADTLVNQGTITAAVAGGTLLIGGYGSFINAGLLSVGAGETVRAGVLAFANTGTISVSAGGTLVLGGPTNPYGATPVWSNTGTIANAGTLVLSGTLGTGQLGRIGGNGTVSLTGTLANAGQTLTLGNGGQLPALSLSGTITGGTIVDAGLLAADASGTALLDGVTYRGTLALGGAGAALRIRDGLFLTGTATVTGAGATLGFQGTETFDHAVLDIGAAGTAAVLDVVHDYGVQGASTLTLGSSCSVIETGLLASLGSLRDTPGDAIVNAGTITAAVSGGTFSILSPGFFNTGQIAVSNGDTLVLGTGNFTNTGTLSVTNAALQIAGSATLAGLGTLKLSQASLGVSGTLSLGSTGTLTIGAGASIPRLSLTGTLTGGTIVDNGGGLACSGGATLLAVKYVGLLDLSRPFSTLSFSNGLQVLNPGGGGPGTIQLTGAGASMTAVTNTVLDNCSINIGSPQIEYYGHTVPAPMIAAAPGTTLVFGTGVTIHTAGLVAQLGNACAAWNDTVTNGGTIVAATPGGFLTLGSSFFNNNNTLVVGNGCNLMLSDVGFTNNTNMQIYTGSNCFVQLYDFFAAPNAGTTPFSNTGTLHFNGGVLQELTGNGLFPYVPVQNAAGALMQGFGYIFAPVNNLGTIDAAYGPLVFMLPVTGTGAVTIEQSCVLDCRQSVASSETITFKGSGASLWIDQPGGFSATIAGFAATDTIDLTTIHPTALTLSGTTITVAGSGGPVQLTTSAPLQGGLEAGFDQNGGAVLSTIAAGTVVQAGQQGMVFWAAPGGDTFQGLSSLLNGACIGDWNTACGIDLTDMAANAGLRYAQNGNTGTLSVSDGTHFAAITLPGQFTGALFHGASDGHGGLLVTYGSH